MKLNIYINELDIDKRIIPLFKGPITEKKQILIKKYKNLNSIESKNHLVYNIVPIYKKMAKLNKNLKIYQNSIAISQLENKNFNILNDSDYNVKIYIKIIDSYLKKWEIKKEKPKKINIITLTKKNKKNKEHLIKKQKKSKINKLIDPDYYHYLLYIKKLESVNICYNPLISIILNKYLITRSSLIKKLNKNNLIKDLNINEWNKLSLKSKLIILWKINYYNLLYKKNLMYKNIITNSKHINNNYLKLNLIQILKDNYKKNKNLKKFYIYKYLYLKKYPILKIEFKKLRKIILGMIKFVNLLINFKISQYTSRRLQKYSLIAYKLYIEFLKEKIKEKLELFKYNSNNQILFPAKDLNHIKSFKFELEDFIYRFKGDKNIINLENSYLDIINNPIDLSNKFLNNINENKNLNLKFNPIASYKQKQANWINYNNYISKNINNLTNILPENRLKMGYMLHKMINKYKLFDSNITVVDDQFPLDIIYFNKKNINKKNIKNKKINKNININKPIVSQYIKSLTLYNKINNGTIINYNKFIGYKFNSNNYFLVKNIYKFLFYSFKGMFCLISRPVFIFKEDKIVIRFFYYILLHKLFKKKQYYKNRLLAPAPEWRVKKNLRKNKIKLKKIFNKTLLYYRTVTIKLLILYRYLNYFKFLIVNKKDYFTFKEWKKFKKLIKLTKKRIYLLKIYKFNWENLINSLSLEARTQINKYFNNKKQMRKFNYHTRKLRKQRKLFKKLAIIPLNHLFNKKFKSITNILSDQLGQNVQLELIRSHYTYKNSNILANFLALLINKIKFIRITRKLLKNSIIKKRNNFTLQNIDNVIPSYLTGLKIKIGGRLMKYRVVRKRTVKLFERGISASGKVNYTDWARFTSKNRRGAFSITVSTGQNIF